MGITFIYTLSDSTGNIRYVGKTSYIKQRLYAHIKESKTNRKSYKNSWVKSLLNKGERPIIDIIDVVPKSEWEFWEKYWIEQFKAWGFNLTNLTLGGQGGNGYKHTEIAKEKMRHKKLGVKLPEYHKKKISDSIKEVSKERPSYNRGDGNSRIYLDKDLLYQKYIVENLSLNKCADIFIVSKKTVFTNITEYGFNKDKSTWHHQLSTNPNKPIVQYDMEGNRITEWDCIGTIVSECGFKKSNILNVIRGMSKSSHGFIWKYAGDEILFREEEKNKEMKPVVQIKDGTIVKYFQSISDASKNTGIQRSSISYCCKGILKRAGGYEWKFSD